MNRAVLAVAGARKTQSIVDACAASPPRRRLVLTFTQSGQADVTGRLTKACTAGLAPHVLGWYAFLMQHFIRPYLPLVFDGRRLQGFNFEGAPGRFASGEARYLDSRGRAYKLHLSKFAFDAANASSGGAVARLERIYEEIYIDEVQDLTGYDLEMLRLLLDSNARVTLVGDVRQSVFDTNPRDPKFKQYRGLNMINWFRAQEQQGRLDLDDSVETWRSNQSIATFSDAVLPKSYGFPPTISRQNLITGHDGVFAVLPSNVDAYLKIFRPQCLRSSVATAKAFDYLTFRNFGEVKGLTFNRVLIFPTGPIIKLLTSGTELTGKSACGLYVGVTRARHSVAFVLADAEKSGLATWGPQLSPSPRPSLSR